MGESGQIREEKQPDGAVRGDNATVNTGPAPGVDVVRRMLEVGNLDAKAIAGVMTSFPSSRNEIAHLLQANVGNAFTQQVLVAATTTTTTTTTTSLDPDDDPAKVPPEYAGIHDDVIRLLLRSRSKMGVFKGRKFWDGVRAIPTADLHTLVQIQKGTAAAGLWPMITELDHIYTYSTSWGIGFTSNSNPRGLTTNGDWGMDHPQIAVRREHENTQHEWFRQNTGAGNAGLHLGIDVGQGYHNVHWDPTNPMAFVGTGTELITSDPIPRLEFHPKGWAVYEPSALVGHVAEIWGKAAPSKNAEPTNEFLAVTHLENDNGIAKEFVDLEEGAKARTKDLARQAKALARLRAARSTITALAAPARAMALQDDATSKTARDALAAKIPGAKKELIDALVELFQHMKAEAPGVDAKGFDSEAGWSMDETKDVVWTAKDARDALLAGRR